MYAATDWPAGGSVAVQLKEGQHHGGGQAAGKEHGDALYGRGYIRLHGLRALVRVKPGGGGEAGVFRR